MADSIAFDRAVDYYDETRGFPPGEERSVAALMVQAGGLTSASRVLEIGIGTGRIALPLSAHVGAIYGIDLSRPMLDRLRAKRTTERIFIINGDASQLPYPDSTFDAVVIVHVLHLIPNWLDVLAELARVLRHDAPLIHGWNMENDSRYYLWDTWNAAVSTEERKPVGAPWRTNPAFLEDEGWRPFGEIQKHAYFYNSSPNTFLDQVKRRIWSATWTLSDEDMARGLTAMEAAIQEQYANPDEPIQAEAKFSVQAYLPPQ